MDYLISDDRGTVKITFSGTPEEIKKAASACWLTGLITTDGHEEIGHMCDVEIQRRDREFDQNSVEG